MTQPLCAQILALSLVVPAAGLSSAGVQGKAASLQSTEAVLLAARCDPSLESMRAGRVEGPAQVGEDERAELRAVQAQCGGSLENLRAGGGGGLLLILAVIILVLVLV